VGGGGAVPVPFNATTMGIRLALFAMDRFPVLEPVPVGEKVTLTVQAPLGASGEEAIQLSVSEKSPLAVMLRTLIALAVTLVTVTCRGELLVPMLWLEKVREVGDVVSMGG